MTGVRFIGSVRNFLWRTLPPTAYQHARYSCRNCSFFLPQTISARFHAATPEVHTFGSGDLNTRLHKANVLAPTRMCRTMTRCGSDKGSGWHNYTTVYSTLFRGWHDRPLRILELGLGTNNPGLMSSMGSHGVPDASLRGWREIFPSALIYGADIDRDILFQEERIKTFYCDQLDATAIKNLWSQPELRDGMNVIINDGLRTLRCERLVSGGFARQSPSRWVLYRRGHRL